MVAPDLLNAVLNLPVADRFDLLSRLQDNLRADPAASPLTESHQRLLEARLADYEMDPEGGTPWHDVKRRLMAKLDRP